MEKIGICILKMTFVARAKTTLRAGNIVLIFISDSPT